MLFRWNNSDLNCNFINNKSSNKVVVLKEANLVKDHKTILASHGWSLKIEVKVIDLLLGGFINVTKR